MNNGFLTFAGSSADFQKSDIMRTLAQSSDPTAGTDEVTALADVEKLKVEETSHTPSESEIDSEIGTPTVSSTLLNSTNTTEPTKKAPRKLVEEEVRVIGRIRRDVWELYAWACGGKVYWASLLVFLAIATCAPVIENAWLR